MGVWFRLKRLKRRIQGLIKLTGRDKTSWSVTTKGTAAERPVFRPVKHQQLVVALYLVPVTALARNYTCKPAGPNGKRGSGSAELRGCREHRSYLSVSLRTYAQLMPDFSTKHKAALSVICEYNPRTRVTSGQPRFRKPSGPFLVPQASQAGGATTTTKSFSRRLLSCLKDFDFRILGTRLQASALQQLARLVI